eukprot:CAMPEP_0117570710 /NCGR_PEP_ID=MMETSP0784-20121206/59346_1 /TAXON_ID=39447 /ORGANISM="" /LENGTH=84 /DNA_ID=CAMNT_0005368787 /DNA_START=457 /DNA_END=710 /DNA_ORIENTATION=+
MPAAGASRSASGEAARGAAVGTASGNVDPLWLTSSTEAAGGAAVGVTSGDVALATRAFPAASLHAQDSGVPVNMGYEDVCNNVG